MTTDTERPPEPSVAVPHFEARLWRELEQSHPQNRPGRHRDRRDRRPWSLRVGIGLVAAAAALVGVLVVRDAGGGDSDTETPDGPAAPASPAPGTAGNGDGDDGGPPPESPPVSVETRIVNATEAAMADSVVKVTQRATDGRTGDSIMWSDEQSGRFRNLLLNVAGEHSYDSGPAEAPGVDTPAPDFPDRPDVMPTDPDVPQILIRAVDYCFGQYEERTNFALPGMDTAGEIRRQIDSGHLVADGTQVYEGRELLKYQEFMPDEPSLTDLGWVLIDPDTYRPVYWVGLPGSDGEYVQVIEFLPRTPENLALLSPPIPEGFEKVDQLRGDGERNDAGCTL